ncbi:MAG: two-component sensor histidine kinase [Bacteroidaceae bacterium]|nr:two-component sensor histidine kinase [Bacteroidaceae bacterium]
MSKPFARFILPISALLLLLTLSFLYYHYEQEENVAVMNRQASMRNINESVFDLMRIRGENEFSDSCAIYLQRYVSHYDKRGLRVTLIDASSGDLLFDSSMPADAVAGNHADRPEIRQALTEGHGYDVRRLSSLMNEEYFYVATYHPEFPFIVRSSLPYKLAMDRDRSGDIILMIVAGAIIAVVLFLIYRIFKMARGAEFATQKLLQHLRTAQEGVAIFDSKRRLVFANSLFGEYADFISSKNLAKVEDILCQPELARIKRFVENEGYYNNSVQETLVSYNIEKSGRVFAVRGVLFRDKGLEVSINDITAAEEQTRIKRQLTQNIAHEFKTPVCGIQGYLETILQNYPDNMSEDQMLHFLERCYSQSNRLNTLVQDISQLNEMTGTAQRINKETVDLSKLVANIVQETGDKLAASEMSVENNLPDNLVINADPSMLYSIFRNLIDNAIAYAGKGTVIKISCFRADEQYYYFTFADNGTGVPDEHLSRIFERFYRVDKGRSRKLGGTGLGLAIVKNAVALHGGTISARNAQGGGLEFVFKLQR